MGNPKLESFSYCLPYIFVFLCLFVMSIPVMSSKDTLKKSALLDRIRPFAAFFIMFAFMGLRGFVTIDWISYYSLYNAMPSLLDGKDAIARALDNVGVEKGYALYMILIKTFSSNYFFFTGVSSLIEFAIMLWAFKRYAPGQVAMCFAFFLIFNGIEYMNLLRNAKAIMLFLASLKYAKEKRMLPYFALNILGCFFHISSVVYFPLYFILTRRFSFTFYVLLFAAGNFIYLFQIKWVTGILSFFADILLGTRISSKIIGYMNNENYNFSYGISIGYIERFFTYILVLLFLRRLCEKDESNIVFVNLTFIYICCKLYLTEMHILGRIAWLFAPSYWVIYSQIYSLLKKDFKWLFLAVLVLYGLLKLGQINSFAYSYDSALWPRYSYEERKPLTEACVAKERMERKAALRN